MTLVMPATTFPYRDDWFPLAAPCRRKFLDQLSVILALTAVDGQQTPRKGYPNPADVFILVRVL